MEQCTDIEKILAKIQKLFELAGNNPSQKEATAAALKAQELMAKYQIGEEDLSNSAEEKICSEMYEMQANGRFKFQLVNVISSNFGCKHYFMHNKKYVVFYGYRRNTVAALETFKYLFKVCHTQGLKLSDHIAYTQKSCKGVYSNYTFGFVSGVQQELERQCAALAIVVPEKVEASYEEVTKDFKTFYSPTLTSRVTKDYQKGIQDGQSAVASRRIEGNQ